MIDNAFPSPVELKKIELKTLDFISNQPFFLEKFPKLANDARDAYIHIKYNTNARNILIDFESEIDGITEDQKRKIHIGGVVNLKQRNLSEYEKYSYYFAICDNLDSPSRLVRKFHFDYVLPDTAGTRRQPHPIFHLQYCGELTPGLVRKGYGENHIQHMSPDLSVPRIPFTPISLALLIDYILREFCDKNIAEKGRQIFEWRSIVKDNEKSLLGPYYNQCGVFLGRHDRDSCLLSNFYYGEE
ncbi:MAG: hypothetical protein ABH882_00300 [Candidatus Omnitrophota bacterium]